MIALGFVRRGPEGADTVMYCDPYAPVVRSHAPCDDRQLIRVPLGMERQDVEGEE